MNFFNALGYSSSQKEQIRMEKILKAGVIGHPIAHSRSPIIHGYWLKKYGIAGEYLRYDIAPQHLRSEVARLVDSGLRGFNVTLPHKESILELCVSRSKLAQKIGAANTITIDDTGRLHADSTDGFGFLQNMAAHVPDLSWRNKTIMILGAGGAARAIVGALMTGDVEQIILVNRTYDKAVALSAELTNQYDGMSEIIPSHWSEIPDFLPRCDVVVNTTSLGMKEQAALEIDLDPLPANAVVSDIVYAPLETELLKQARCRGLTAVTGIGMLLHQARPGFERWFGVKPDVTPELEALVLS